MRADAYKMFSHSRLININDQFDEKMFKDLPRFYDVDGEDEPALLSRSQIAALAGDNSISSNSSSLRTTGRSTIINSDDTNSTY